MAKYASKVVAQAKAWPGLKESDGSYKVILDTYNSQEKLPRGHKMNTSDAWCAAFVSAVAVKLGYTDIIPTECSCGKMIEKLKAIGSWVEKDDYVPQPGDLCFYDWEAPASGENTGAPDHVGIVEAVILGTIVVIEGNYSNSVKRREIPVNYRYIRGFGVPKYDKEINNYKIKIWQNSAIADGYKFPKYGADGEWGSECESVARKAIVKKRLIYTNKNLTRIVQATVGVKIDGLCGKDTVAAIKAYQKKHGLTVDGVVGLNTWKKILGV
jgi:peptidoglycan hydrolase-like protein with peptidoglycan-binding domain